MSYKIAKISTILNNGLFLLPIFQLFLIDRSNEGMNSILYYIISSISISFILIYLFYFSIRKELSFSYYEVFLILALLIFMVFKTIQSGFTPYFIYIIAAHYITKNNFTINPKILNISVIVSFLSLLFQFFLSLGRERLGNSAIDPNFSGYYFFLFFLLCWKLKFKKIALVIIFIGLLTLSRNFLLAISLFILFSNNLIKHICSKLKILNYYILVLISMSILLFGGIYYLNNIKIEYRYNNSTDRLLDVKDESNQERFLINTIIVSKIYQEPQTFFWGITQKNYISKVYRKFPHNAFLALIIGHGLFLTFLYLIFFGKIFNTYIDTNVPYIISLFAYFLFLTGGAISGVEILYFAYLFKFKPQEI